MRVRDLAETSAAVAATRSRTEKVERLAATLRGLGDAELAPGTSWLAGELRQGPIGVGWAALRDLPAPAAEATVSVAEADAALTRLGTLSGPGSQAERRRLLAALLARADAVEQRYLVGLLGGELRQGALVSLVADAVARSSAVPPAVVRRALMLHGDLGDVAALARAEGEAGLRAVGLEVGRPVGPMLAGTAPDVGAALARIRPAAVEWKLDGARIQIHRRDDDVRVFTRSLDDVTARVPEVVEVARALPVRAAVLDGEAIALREDGRPHPFQVTGARFASRAGTVPLTPLLFDVLHLDGEDLLDRPGAERAEALAAVVPEASRAPRAVAEDADAAEAVLAAALARGHEGVVVKALDAPYAAGRRGTGWLKVKPVHTLDLLVLAVEWGHGRRSGLLSNLHLGARDPSGGPPVMLGKTFKGLTDAMLAWQTEHLLALAVERAGHVVRVRPELVVEVAFDGVQASPRYPGGVALRFARVVRHRPDKAPEEADTLDAVLALRAA